MGTCMSSRIELRYWSGENLGWRSGGNSWIGAWAGYWAGVGSLKKVIEPRTIGRLARSLLIAPNMLLSLSRLKWRWYILIQVGASIPKIKFVWFKTIPVGLKPTTSYIFISISISGGTEVVTGIVFFYRIWWPNIWAMFSTEFCAPARRVNVGAE